MGQTRNRHGGAFRILIVDDDPIIRALCTKILTQAGYVTQAADSSSDAMWLTASSAEPFDLMVVDVYLPISDDLKHRHLRSLYPPVNGDEMVRHILAIVTELRVLFISTSSRDTLQKERIDLGPAPFLKKPLAADTLLQSVKITIEGPPLRLKMPVDAQASPGDQITERSQLVM